MKTVAIYGIEHKGCSYHVVQLIKNRLAISEDDFTEFFLPKDMPHFCIGCTNCFWKGETFCPHRESITPIKEALWNAELIIFASPVYAFHVSGQMKTLLDHFAFQFMAHRPHKSMFSKIALAVSTGAGGGMKSTLKDMTDSLKQWGISDVFTLGHAVAGGKWEEIPKKNKLRIEDSVQNISNRIMSKMGKSQASLKTKILFYIFRMMQKKHGFVPYDKAYWDKEGWLDKKRPWKK